MQFVTADETYATDKTKIQEALASERDIVLPATGEMVPIQSTTRRTSSPPASRLC